jgi:hypothetical protein
LDIYGDNNDLGCISINILIVYDSEDSVDLRKTRIAAIGRYCILNLLLSRLGRNAGIALHAGVVLKPVPTKAHRTSDAGCGVFAVEAVFNFASETVAFLEIMNRTAFGALELAVMISLAADAVFDRTLDAGVG